MLLPFFDSSSRCFTVNRQSRGLALPGQRPRHVDDEKEPLVINKLLPDFPVLKINRHIGGYFQITHDIFSSYTVVRI